MAMFSRVALLLKSIFTRKQALLIFATLTFRQSLVTFTGTVINGLLGAGFYIASARALGPADFGLLVVAITVLTLVTDIGNLGTDTGLVRFVGKYLKSAQDQAYRFLKLSLEVKIFAWLFIFIVGWLAAPTLAVNIFAKSELITPLRIVFFGVGGVLLFAFSTSVFQALQRFYLWSGIQIITNTIRLAAVGVLWWYGSLSLESSVAFYVLLPFLGFFAFFLFMPRGFLKIKGEFSIAREFFHYNKWVALFTFVAAFSSRLDTLISARLLNPEALGFYAAASQLVVIVPQIVAAFGTVLAPKMAGMGKIEDLIAYLKKTQLMVTVLAVLGILSIPLIVFFIPLIYGPSYASAVPPLFTVLFLAMLVFLISVPVHSSVFYYFGCPKLFVWVSFGHLVIIGIVGWFMISHYGAMGASLTVLIGMIFNFLVPAVWVLRKILIHK